MMPLFTGQCLQSGRHQEGFTIIEIIILLIIIGVLAGAAYSSRSFMAVNDLERHAVLLSSRIANARNQAVLHGRAKFVINTAQKTMTTSVLSRGSMVAGGAIPGEPSSYSYAADDFTITGSSIELEFDSRGMLCASGSSAASDGKGRFRCGGYDPGRSITLQKGDTSRTITVQATGNAQ